MALEVCQTAEACWVGARQDEAVKPVVTDFVEALEVLDASVEGGG